MKKTVSSIAALLSAMSAQAQPYNDSSHVDYRSRIGFEIINGTTESMYSIDSSDYDPDLGSPTSKLEYKMDSVNYANLTFDIDNNQHYLGGNIKWATSHNDGNIIDSDWFSKDYVESYGYSETLFSQTDSTVKGYDGISLSLNHSIKLSSSDSFALYFTHSINYDHDEYEAYGVVLLDDYYGFYAFDGYEVGDILVPNTYKSLSYENTFLSYSLGLKGDLEVSDAIIASFNLQGVALGNYEAKDIHHLRDDLKQNPSIDMKSESITGYSGEVKITYVQPHYRNHNYLEMHARAYIKELTAETSSEDAIFHFTDVDLPVDLYESTRRASGIALGISYNF